MLGSAWEAQAGLAPASSEGAHSVHATVVPKEFALLRRWCTRSFALELSICTASGEHDGPKMAVPPSSNVTKPASNAASQRAERSSPLLTSSRWASLVQADHGTMCEALSRAESLIPVTAQRPSQY